MVDKLMSHAENLTLVDLCTDRETPPSLCEPLERRLEFDDAIRNWRQTHILMVERVIGARPGTGWRRDH